MHAQASPRAAPLLVAAALLVGACAPAGRSEPAGSVAARIRAHVAFLADDALRGREAGTPDYEIAARYVASQFALLGLEPAGDDGGFEQEVPLVRYRIEPESARFEIARGERVERLSWREEFLMGGDPVRAETSVTAPVVFAGHGITAPDLDYDDYAGIDAAGKIVLTLRGAPASFPHNQRAHYSSGRTKRAEAVRHGAVGALSLRSAEDEARVPWSRIARNAGRPGLGWLDAEGAVSDWQEQIRGGASLSHPAAERLLAGAPQTLGEVLAAATAGEVTSFDLPVSVTLARRSSQERVSSSNVVARLPGADPALRDELVVYTAHLDHVGVGAEEAGDSIYNGAYDNATGVAVMLEVARWMAAGPRPRRSIAFVAVTGEERGLLGSDYWVRHPTIAGAVPVANVNLDMPLLLYPLADLIAFGAEHSDLAGAVERAAANVGLELSGDPMPEEVLFVRSDQYSFVRQGIPAVFLVPGQRSRDPEIDGAARVRDFLRTHYHMPSDDLGVAFDADSAERFTRANLLIGLEVANRAARPRWNEGDFFGARYGAAATAATAP